MKINMEADYAIRIVYCLAKSGDKMEAKSVAEEMKVTLRFTLKILRKLVIAGFVKSFKGIHGGYMIAKDPDAISLLDIIEACDGPILLNRCLAENADCNRVSHKEGCPFHKEFCKINRLLREEFDKVKFSSLSKSESAD